MPSGGKKSIGNTRKQEYGPVAAPGSCQTCLVHWDPETIAWRVTGCSRILHYFFEEGRTSPSCCRAQNLRRVPPRSPLLQVWGWGWVRGVFPPQFRFQCKRSGWKRGEVASRAGAARLSAPRRRRQRRLGAALSAWRIGQLTLQPEERLPLQRCVRTCKDLAGNIRSALFVWTSPRLFSFLPPRKSLSDKRRSLLAFNVQN